MTLLHTTLLFAVITATDDSTAERHAPADVQEVQLSVEKGLFFVERSAMRWWTTKKCSSCHEGPALLFAHNIAKRQGFPVDQRKLDFWTDKWVLVDGLVHDRKSDGRKDGGGMLGAPLTLLFRDLEFDQQPARARTFGKLMQIVAADWHQEDGSWDISVGLDYTPWITLALSSFAESDMPLDDKVRTEVAERLERTEAWIREQEPSLPEKTEDLAAWLVYEHRRGDKSRAAALQQELLNRRLDDGTWGITKDDGPHLLVTGAVLFALTGIGLDATHPAVAQAQRLLLDRQAEDGSWHEGGRIFDDGSEKDDPTYRAWATAVISAALSQSIPKLPPGTKPLYTRDPELVAVSDKLAREAAKGYVGSGSKTMNSDE